MTPITTEASLSAWRKQGSLATYWADVQLNSESSLSARRKLGSSDTYWADVQADLSLRWAHMPFCWFWHETAQIFTGNYCTGTHHSDMKHVMRKPVFGVCDQVGLKHREQLDSCRYWLLLTCNFCRFPVKLVKFPSAKSEHISKKYL